MSKQEDHIKWLFNELPLWRQEGIIEESAVSRLHARYHQVKEESTNLFLVIFSSLASLLIGVGIISIFATNWDDFDRLTKTILSFIPLLVGAGLFLFTNIKKSEVVAWRESTSGFLMLSFGASMGLISQVYHNGGTLQDFLTFWLLFSLPLVYFFKSYFVFLIYAIFSVGLGVSTNGDNSLVQSWLIPFAIVPYFILQLRSQPSENKTIVSAWVLTLGFGGLLFANFWEVYGFLLVMMSTLASMFYLVGKYFHGNETSILKQPMQLLSYLTVIFLSFLLTFFAVTKELMDEMVDDYFIRDFEASDLYYTVFLVFFSAIAGYFLFKLLAKGLKVNWFVVLSPLLFLIMLFLSEDTALFVVALFILFLFVFGVFMVVRGVNQKSMLELNLGMLLIIAIILSKFFEVDVPLTLKGVVSILLGIGFLITNIILSKRLADKTN